MRVRQTSVHGTRWQLLGTGFQLLWLRVYVQARPTLVVAISLRCSDDCAWRLLGRCGRVWAGKYRARLQQCAAS